MVKKLSNINNKNYFAYLRNIKEFLTFVALHYIVQFNNVYCNTQNDNKVHNHGKIVSIGYCPEYLNRIYHKRNKIQGWECEFDDF